jgi:hypothetical protein
MKCHIVQQTDFEADGRLVQTMAFAGEWALDKIGDAMP